MNRIQILDSILLQNQVNSLLNDQLSAFEHRSLPRNIRRFYTQHGDILKLIIECILLKMFVIDRNGTYADILTGQRLSSTKLSRYLFVIGTLIKQNTSIPLLHKFSTIANFLNSIVFLNEGVYPTLLHRITRTKYINVSTSLTSNPESISYEFQDRQLIWSAFAEAAAALQLPRLWNRNIKKNQKNNQLVVVNNGICPMDGHIVCNAHIVNCCGKIYCYICAVNLIGDNCLSCGKLVESVSVYI